VFKNLDLSDYHNLSDKQLASMIQPYYQRHDKEIRFQEFKWIICSAKDKNLALEKDKKF
jgi:hypothetical protein